MGRICAVRIDIEWANQIDPTTGPQPSKREHRIVTGPPAGGLAYSKRRSVVQSGRPRSHRLVKIDTSIAKIGSKPERVRQRPFRRGLAETHANV